MITGTVNHPLQILPAHRLSRPALAKRLLKAMVNYCRPPQAGKKPAGMHVPDRTWRRHSALLLTLHKQHHNRDHG